MTTDLFSDIYQNKEAAGLLGDSFVYKHPITNEIREGAGKAPLPWGEYPEGVDENSDEAKNYDLFRSDFLSLPDDIIDDETIQLMQSLPEGSQINDPNWIVASKIVYDFLNPEQVEQNNVNIRGVALSELQSLGSNPTLENDDYANYGIKLMSSFNNNISAMLFDVNKMADAPTGVAKAFYYLMETSDREGISLANAGRGIINMFSDPTTYVGLGTLGIGIAGKYAGKKLTRMGFKELLKGIVLSKPTSASLAVGAESALYSAADSYARQTTAINADVQENIDVGRLATDAATGAVIGERLGAGLPNVGETLRRGVVKLGEGAKERLAEGGTKIMSGVDVDPLLAKMGDVVDFKKPTDKEPGIIAFHGSGADFDKFRLDYIGTGEGAQVYGKGLYFTDTEDIAKFYKNNLSTYTLSVKGKEHTINPRYMQKPQLAKALGFENYRRNKDSSLDEILVAVGDAIQKNQTPLQVLEQRYRKIKASKTLQINDSTDAEQLRRNKLEAKFAEEDYIATKNALIELDLKVDNAASGKTYKVALSPKPDELIDYDLPLSRQPDKVKMALKNIAEIHDISVINQFGESASFGSFQDALVEKIGSEYAMQEFFKAGIKGIKYLDNASRNTFGGKLLGIDKLDDGQFQARIVLDDPVRQTGLGGSGRVITTSKPYKSQKEAEDWANKEMENKSSNYVIFDQDAIEILAKYGIVGPVAVTALSKSNDSEEGS